MLRVGLTGGIASGKTTVALLLRKSGYQVLDADALGHELILPGHAPYDEIVREFGAAILAPDLTIDRAKLGAVIFAEPEKRARLNQILHPPIMDATQKWFLALAKGAAPEFAFVEAALLIEAGYRSSLDRILVCWSRRAQQLERLTKRGFSRKDAEARIASQMSGDEKRRQADFVIDCSASLEKTETQVRDAIAFLQNAARSAAKSS